MTAPPPTPTQQRQRRLRRLLRTLPRQSNLGRYPFLKYFAASARRLPFLWSYRPEHVRPALYAGSILTLLPLMGVQMVLALALCILFRANLPIAAGLQLISNPLTAAPLYGLTFAVGSPLASTLLPHSHALLFVPVSLGLGASVLGLALAMSLHLTWALTCRRRADRRARVNRASTSAAATLR
jgi:uncharacterized protein (DUF2062 family)